MARRRDDDPIRSVGFGVTLDEDVAAQLDRIMAQDGEPKRSRAIAKLVTEEAARRKRRKTR